MENQSNITYTRSNPFLASIKERYRLSKPGSKKNTNHIVLDLSGSGITYQIGDSIGISPMNDPHLVQWTLRAMRATGKEVVIDKQSHSFTLLEFLQKKANITELSKKLVGEVAKRQTNPEKKEKLDHLFEEHNKELFKDYIAAHELWDFLEENEEVHFENQELCQLLMPLLPRLYSISSSNQVVGEEVHLTVAMLEYETNELLRKGVCTHYLCNLAPIHEKVIPVYIQPHHGFTLPTDPNASMIMIGPGTGIAPFRAFMQERMQQKATGKNWLFFGEWNEKYDYFYEEEWQKLHAEGKLEIDVAFSRDQDFKVYVQHRMFEKGQQIYEWLVSGAYFYVCGDAHRMAKDVEAILLQIIQNFGRKDESEAKAYLKQLRQEKRYLRDVY